MKQCDSGLAKRTAQLTAGAVAVALLLMALLTATGLTLSAAASPQPVVPTTMPGGNLAVFAGPAPGRTVVLTESLQAQTFWDSPPRSPVTAQTGSRQATLPGPDDQVRVIVLLQDPPVAAYESQVMGPPGGLTSAATIEVRRYSASLAARRQAYLSQLESLGVPVKVNQAFGLLLNGFALSIKMQDLERLKTRQVMGVYRDYEMRATLTDSVPLIGARRVWAMTGPNGEPVTGQGVRVAILDSGVDYTHPDLGGCLGPGCKVIGGYDFVNGDNDPMDDFGHGTHVTGIVTASGTLTGVAPGSRLLAYKVLNAYGFGSASNTIAALERAADPDGDPATDDRAQVCNVSLGGPGAPDDPLSQAVDHAVGLGMIVVVSAGNSGSGYETLGSPGVARRALTVASSGKSDELAPYSSRGPVSGSYDTLKPDITAPGTFISSTVPLSGPLGSPNRYALLSGTSMAAPHVAGAAALIKQLHPTWSPDMIKANLMNAARDLGLGVFEQGTGRVDVYAAADSPMVAVPATLALGIDDLTRPVWSAARTFTLTNVSNQAAHYALSISNALPVGVTAMLSKSEVTLAPGESCQIELSVTVANATVPDAATAPYAYEGKIVTQSGTHVVKVPFAFIKTPLLNIALDEDAWLLDVHDRADTERFYGWPGLLRSVLLPKGDYDVMVVYQDISYRIVKERVPVDTITNLTIHKDEANNQLLLRMLAKDSREIVLDGSRQVGTVSALIHLSSGHGFMFGGSGWRESAYRLRVSNLSPAYREEDRMVVRGADMRGDQYTFHYAVDGISGNVTLQNDPAQFKEIEYEFVGDPSTRRLDVLEWFATDNMGFGTDQLISAPFKLKAYYAPVPKASSLFKFHYFDVYPESGPFASPFLVETPYFYVRDRDNVDLYFRGSPFELAYTTTAGYFPIGQAPPHWYGKFQNSATEIRVMGARGVLNLLYLNQMQDFKQHDNLPYELYQAGTRVASGVLTGVYDGWRVGGPMSMPIAAAAAYTLTVPYNQYWVGARAGHARATVGFDTRNADKNPPTLLTLNILAGDRFVDTVPPSIPAEIRFSAEDDGTLSEVTLAYGVDEIWRDLQLYRQGNVYTATVPGLPNDSYVALKITAKDAQGNWLSYEVDPAFVAREPTPALSAYLPLVVR